jgi:plastocyanin
VPSVVETCATADYVDQTATAAVTVTPWDTTLGKKCIKVKAGSTVTWAASATHPLVATGGTTPSPIPTTAATAPQTLTFPNAGVYGFQCAVHLSLMHGAIWVVP